MNEKILLAAADWHVRSQRDDMDWDAFTLWLEADGAHREAFDAIAIDDAELSELRHGIAKALTSNPVADNDDAIDVANDDWAAPTPRRWRRWAGGGGIAIAAAAVATLALVPDADQTAPAMQQYVASNGVKRIALDDGVQVALANGARLSVASDGSNEMTLHGVAFFRVQHDPNRTLTIHAGAFSVVDLGTSFEIASTPDSVRVAVSHGSVAVRSQRLATPLRLDAGQAMASLSGRKTVERLNVAPATVGSFRRGQLVYDDVPLAVVAAELGQYTNAHIILEPGIGQRRFSGSLSLGDRSELVSDVAKLMDLQVRRNGNAVRLAYNGGDSARQPRRRA